MALKKNDPRQWEIWLFDPDPVKGNEIGKKVRPAVVVSSNTFNMGFSGLVIVVPMTSKERNICSHVRIEPSDTGLDVPSFAICEQIRSVSRERLVKRVGIIHDSSKIRKIHEWLISLIWIE